MEKFSDLKLEIDETIFAAHDKAEMSEAKKLKLAEVDGANPTESVSTLSPTTLDVIWTKNVRGEEGFERTDSMLGAGWTESFLAKMFLGRSSSREFLKADMGLTIVMIMGLFVTL